MVQTIIIGALLIIAVFYLGRTVYRSFQGNSHCETGCGKCGVNEISALPPIKK